MEPEPSRLLIKEARETSSSNCESRRRVPQPNIRWKTQGVLLRRGRKGGARGVRDTRRTWSTKSIEWYSQGLAAMREPVGV